MRKMEARTDQSVHRERLIMILHGDYRDHLRDITQESISCVITSPPFWDATRTQTPEIGTETTPDAYVETIVDLLANIRWTLSSRGHVFLVLGETKATETGPLALPWKTLLALATDGWTIATTTTFDDTVVAHLHLREYGGIPCLEPPYGSSATDRAYQPLSHDFIRFCIKSSTLTDDTILDPCCGSGTVGMIAERLNRKFTGIEWDHASSQLAQARCSHSCNAQNPRKTGV